MITLSEATTQDMLEELTKRGNTLLLTMIRQPKVEHDDRHIGEIEIRFANPDGEHCREEAQDLADITQELIPEFIKESDDA